MDKSYPLKVNIKTQTGESERKTVAIYVPLFCTGSPEALLKFITPRQVRYHPQQYYTGPGPVHRTPKVWDDKEPGQLRSARSV